LAVGPLEDGALGSETVDVGGDGDGVAVTTEVGAQVVYSDEEDVRRGPSDELKNGKYELENENVF